MYFLLFLICVDDFILLTISRTKHFVLVYDNFDNIEYLILKYKYCNMHFAGLVLRYLQPRRLQSYGMMGM